MACIFVAVNINMSGFGDPIGGERVLFVRIAVSQSLCPVVTLRCMNIISVVGIVRMNGGGRIPTTSRSI